MSQPAPPRYRYRSILWPALLILVGVLALLVDVGALSSDRLLSLFSLWPLVLIVIGLELIVRRGLSGSRATLASAAIVILAVVVAAVYVTVGPITGASQTEDVSGPTGGLAHASLEVDVGAASVTIRSSDSLGQTLYHAHIEYSGSKPDVSFDATSGAVRISQSSDSMVIFQRRFVMDLELNSAVTWSIVDNSGASNDTFKLAGMQVASIEINTGASREDITLGAASGIVSVTVNGGALTVSVHRPAGTEASVDVSGGAVSLNADGKQTHSIGSASYETAGFENATDAYQIQVNGGVCTVTLDVAPGTQ